MHRFARNRYDIKTSHIPTDSYIKSNWSHIYPAKSDYGKKIRCQILEGVSPSNDYPSNRSLNAVGVVRCAVKRARRTTRFPSFLTYRRNKNKKKERERESVSCAFAQRQRGYGADSMKPGSENSLFLFAYKPETCRTIRFCCFKFNRNFPLNGSVRRYGIESIETFCCTQICLHYPWGQKLCRK